LIFGLEYFTAAPYEPHWIGHLKVSPSLVLLVALWFFTVGAIVTVSSVILYKFPEKHRKLGVVITVFSILGGELVALIGGILAIAWKPNPAPSPIEKITRICLKCGRVLKEDGLSVRFCPYCGKNLEILTKKEKKES